MTTVSRNILANVVGSGLGTAVFLAVVPVYLRLLGAETYGLVGLFTTVMVLGLALDLGLSATLNREAARVTPSEAARFADVAATLRATCWGLGLVAGGLFAVVAPAIATRWLTFSTLSVAEVRGALALMGAALPALVARGFSLAGLNGLQRQRLANLIQVGGIATRALVSVAALLLVERSITVFLVAQLLVLFLEAAVASVALSRSLPAAARGGRIRFQTIRPALKFAGGVGATMVFGLALMSLDQVILSAILPLAQFGYYTVAVGVAAALGQLVQPVTTAVYPRFSQLAHRAGGKDIAEEYHFFSQLVAVLVLPLAGLLVFFPDQILDLWTGAPELVHHAAPVLGLRAVGTVLNALIQVPHVVQLAFGWSALAARINAVSVVVMVPVTVALALAGGGVGAALGWIGLNLSILLVLMTRMHRRVLTGELARWYGHVGAAMLAVAVLTATARVVMPEVLSSAARIAWMGATALLTTLAAGAATATVRRRLLAAARARLA